MTFANSTIVKLIILQSPCFCPIGAVDGDLVVVGAQPVAVSVVVRKEATLEHLVGAENRYFSL